MLSIQKARQFAVQYGLTLCDHCEQPREQHVGFDHGRGKCLLATRGIDMGIAYPNKDRRDDAITRINKYNAAHQNAEDKELFIGSGI